jgi:hypothetical protein
MPLRKTNMERMNPYHGTRDELLCEIAEIKAVVFAEVPLHDDPVEDVAIRGIWGALLDPLLKQLEIMDHFQKIESVPQ